MPKRNSKQYIYGNPNWIDGRMNRLDYLKCFVKYLFFIIFILIAGGIAYALDTGDTLGIISFAGSVLLGAIYYWRWLMSCVKRFHDLGLSGWYALLVLGAIDCSYTINTTTVSFNLGNYLGEKIGLYFSLFGLAVCLLLLTKRGTVGTNRYGPSPCPTQKGNKSF